MTRRALSAVAGFLACCLSLSAQETPRLQSIPFTLRQPGPKVAHTREALFSTFNSSYYGFPWLTLADGRRFSLSNTYSWIDSMPPDLLPDLSVEMAPRIRTSTAAPRRDSSDNVVEVQRKFFDYVGGEVGFLYGRSTGKFSREVEQGYILGEMGNDKTQITVGGFYEKQSGRVPRFSH